VREESDSDEKVSAILSRLLVLFAGPTPTHTMILERCYVRIVAAYECERTSFNSAVQLLAEAFAKACSRSMLASGIPEPEVAHFGELVLGGERRITQLPVLSPQTGTLNGRNRVLLRYHNPVCCDCSSGSRSQMTRDTRSGLVLQ
jgi:hypothetical protein